jgi:hypothetical protein
MPYAWYTAWPSGYYQTCCARTGTNWVQVPPHSHRRRFTTVQPYRSVFPGRWSYQIEQVVRKQFLKDNDLAKASFKKWTWDYQRQSPGRPMQATNWFVGLLAFQRSLHSCWYMNSCNFGHSYLAILTVATSIKKWSCQQCRRRANRSSFWNSRRIRTRSEMNITVCHLHCAKSEEDNCTHK